MIKVSVIIPVYNVEPYLRECLNSVKNQTLKDIEIICIDDGSTDNSLEILNEYAASDNRFSVLSQKNLGAGTARNKGISVAQGEYLIFLDSDDYFDKDMLSSCVEQIEKDCSDIVIFNWELFDMQIHQKRSSGRPPLPESPFNPKRISDRVFQLVANNAWNKMFRHSFVLEHSLKFQEIPRANDLFFSLFSVALANKISTIPKAFVAYRVGMKTNLQASNHRTPHSFFDALKALKAALIDKGLYEVYKQSLLNSVLSNTLYTLDSISDHPVSYIEFCSFMKYDIESEFNLSMYTGDYYFDQIKYTRYINFINTPVDIANPNITPCPDIENRLYNKKVIVYGIGRIGQLLVPYLQNNPNIELLGVCISSTASDRLWECENIEYILNDINEWKNITPDATILIATAEQFVNEISMKCIEAGFKNIVPAWKELLIAGHDFKHKKICEQYKEITSIQKSQL